MNMILELSKNLKAVSQTCKRGKAKHSQNNAELENLKCKIEHLIQYRMKILELKNTTTKIKNSVDAPNNRMEITRRLVHLRMEQYKLPNLNNRGTRMAKE